MPGVIASSVRTFQGQTVSIIVDVETALESGLLRVDQSITLAQSEKPASQPCPHCSSPVSCRQRVHPIQTRFVSDGIVFEAPDMFAQASHHLCSNKDCSLALVAFGYSFAKDAGCAICNPRPAPGDDNLLRSQFQPDGTPRELALLRGKDSQFYAHMHLQDLMPEVPDPPPPPDEFHTYLARFMRGNYLGCAELGIALFENRHTLEVGQILLISLQRMHLLKEATLVADSLLNASADNPFIHALICLTLGTMPPDGALRLAGSQPDKCRVNFYAGARFNTLGLYDEARTYLSRCLQENINLLEHDLAKAEIHRSTDANLDVETLYAVQKVEEYMTAATYHYQKGQLNHKFGEAARVAAEAVACAKAHRLHPDSETSISALNILASCLAANGETGDAVPLAFEVMERSLRVFGEKDKRYIVSVSNLGGILRISKHFDESEKWYKKALTMLRDAVGENHRDFAICLDGLGGLYADMGKQEESWRLCLRATEILRRTCGEDNVEYAVGIGNQLRNISTQLHNGFESRFKDGFKPDDENPH